MNDDDPATLLLRRDCAKLLSLIAPFALNLRIGNRVVSLSITDAPTEAPAPEAKPATPAPVAPSMPPPLTPCELDIVDALKASDRPLTRPRIIDALEAVGKIHGESTVGHSLAHLVTLGVLRSNRGRRGYTLASPTEG